LPSITTRGRAFCEPRAPRSATARDATAEGRAARRAHSAITAPVDARVVGDVSCASLRRSSCIEVLSRRAASTPARCRRWR
jgi:hypothetical protein